MCFPVFGLFFFSFNNQTIVYICVLARSHKEEHPNKGEKSQTGKWAGKENPDSLSWVPMDVGFKVHHGGRGDRGGRAPSKEWVDGDFPGGPMVKNQPSSAGHVGLIPGWEIKIPPTTGQLSLHAATKTPPNHFK